MRLCSGVVGALALSLVLAVPKADYFDGNSLKELADSVNPASSAMFRGYVAGLQDAGNGLSFCVAPNVRLSQAAAVVKKYLADHPQSWHLPAHQLVVEALTQAFPCRRNLPQLPYSGTPNKRSN